MKNPTINVAAAELVRCHHLWYAEAKRGCWFDFRIVVTKTGAADYESLAERFTTRGQLEIGANDCEGTPYGVHGNLIIRAAHDLGHVLYGHDFSRKGELMLAAEQSESLLRFCRPELRKQVEALYWLDTVGSQLHHFVHGKFTTLKQSTFLSRGMDFLGVKLSPN